MTPTERSTTVVAVFDNTADAQSAVRELTGAGIPREDISLVAQDREGRYTTSTGTDTNSSDGTTIGENVAGGALFGGLGGLLIGLGALAIPGIGPVVAAGPLAATIGGALVGAAGGGIIGALKDAGVPDEDADVYAESVRRGGTLVSVRCDSASASRVSDTLNRYNPIDIDERRTSYRDSGWNRFDHAAEPYSGSASSTPSSSARPSSRVYGQGGSAAGNRGLGLDDPETDYRSHYQNNYGTSGSYEQYRPAYEFGRQMRGQDTYRGRSFNDVEDTLKTDYLRNNPNSTWDQTKGAVRYGWERMTGQRGEDPTGVTHGTRNLDSAGDADWRSHYQSNYSGSGSYDQYRPAYDYGSRMASDSRYNGRSFEDVQDTLKTDYLRNNPNSTWDQTKGAIRYGWERMTGQCGEDPSGVTHGTRTMGSELDTDWRSHYQSNYSNAGGYDQYRPAYDYGSRMAGDTRYSGRSFSDVEDTLKTDYLRNNPNSTWDNVKGAVRYGWEKVSGKR